MKAVTILIHMYLAGQDKRGNCAGYAMAALIVGIAVMAVMMTVVMPVWKQMVQREKEEELVFRGEQIAHSIGMFQRKFANAYPPTLDVLVEQKFLRKKYKDPITNEDFVPLTQAQGQAAAPGNTATAGRGQQPAPPAAGGRGTNPFAGTATPGAAVGGIIGVTSKSTNVSIRLYKGRSHYNEWAFVYTPPAAAGGAGPGGAGGAGGRGQRGQGPNQPPNSPFPNAAPFPGPGGFPGRGDGRGPAGPGGRGGTPFPFPTGPGRGR
jgi:type II secretory pathway pseudopilin PulG